MIKQLLTVSFFLLFSLASRSQMTFSPLNGPQGIQFERLSVSPSGAVLGYAIGQGMVISTNDGANWRVVNDGLPADYPDYQKDIDVDQWSESFYALVNEGLYELSAYNNYQEWRLLSNNFGNTNALMAITAENRAFIHDFIGIYSIDLFNPNQINFIVDAFMHDLKSIDDVFPVRTDVNYFVGTDQNRQKGIYRFSDDGQTVELVQEITTLTHLNYVDQKPDGRVVFFLSNNILQSKSPDSLNVLVPVPGATTIDSLTWISDGFTTPNGDLYAVKQLGIYVQRNNTNNWERTIDLSRLHGFFNYAYHNHAKTSFYLYPDNHCPPGLFALNDPSFDQIDRLYPEATNPITRDILINDAGHLFADLGLCHQVSTDQGQTWNAFRVNGKDISRLQFDGQQNYYAEDTDRQLWLSTDSGLNWTQIRTNNAANTIFSFHLTPDDVLYINDQHVDSSGSTRHVYRSYDRGATWELFQPDLYFLHKIIYHPNGDILIIGDRHWLGSDDVLRVSTDGGQTFTDRMTDLKPQSMILAPNGTLHLSVYDGRNYGQHYVTWDNGLSYIRSPHPYPIAFNSEGAQFNLSNDLGGPQRVRISTDDGKTNTLLFENPNIYSTLINKVVLDDQGYAYIATSGTPIYRSDSSTLRGNVLYGTVTWDKDFDCENSAADTSLPLAIIRAAGVDTFYAVSGFAGNYQLSLPPGDFSIEVIPFNAYWEACLAPQTVSFTGTGQTDTVDLFLQSIHDCPLNTITIQSSRFRPCLPGKYYVYYQNLGSAVSPNTSIELTFDAHIVIDSATVPWSSVDTTTYTFMVSDLPMFNSGTFQVFVRPDCDSISIGETVCAEAHIYPDSLCVPLDSLWSGASLTVDGVCAGDSLRFIISNQGFGDMNGTTRYIVIEDDAIMYTSPPFQLNAGEQLNFSLFANGSTYRVEVPQVPGHPGNSMPSVSIEACGPNNAPSQGYISLFPQNDTDPFVDIVCTEVTGSYDPNDKQGFPIGYGPEHFIAPNTEIEYLIRFQNTGNDTAFRVVIVDTLSAKLDVESIVAGAASHPYTWTLKGEGILEFQFNNILLPDSSTNLLESEGFVSYTISQQPDLPDNTVINNQAAIYFDFNDPIFTNTTWHTIGRNFIVTNTEEASISPTKVKVFPNPFRESTTFSLEETAHPELEFRLYNLSGQLVRQQRFSGTQFHFNRDQLTGGIYFYHIDNGVKKVASGKIILQ